MNKDIVKKIHTKVEEDLSSILENVSLYPTVYIDDDGRLIGSWLVGNVLSMNPSGKYYMPWTSNQTAEDTVRDQLYWETLENRLEEELEGYWLEQGSGDPLDVFVMKLLVDDDWGKALFYEEEQTLLACTDEGYPVAYMLPDGTLLCKDCANAALFDGKPPTGIHTNFEDTALYCGVCGERILSAYGEEESK